VDIVLPVCYIIFQNAADLSNPEGFFNPKYFPLQ
jgi:hypothetical protein